MKRVHVFISGTVQGVFFRDSAREQADDLDVNGWIKNKRDGRVEGVFEGPDEAVDALVTWCRTGPPSAIVDGVEVHEEPFGEEFLNFQVVH